ncbi:hypothetical protein NG54_16685 [Heyndrickxia ginsengihumi]|uniref:Uncharacterized protein n=1 Tax=Heyndrickxia ginsengihumi TaxID=363870 RepID=A0A0A6V860_9BACI|nr:hypothetical protein [Heyndrickxia ginsengihumi]KHD84260.1 hypothetical protein NG54_16685 [Heyndrickxia ginsengihumi]
MNGITIKSILLGIGIIILICLLIHIPNKGYHRVTIVEKYYAANPKNNSKAVGVTTKKRFLFLLVHLNLIVQCNLVMEKY